VNLDAGESNLATASKSELSAALAGVPHEYLTSAEAFLDAAERTRQELWPTLLALLVAVLMLEQGLAWWFGTPRRARPGAVVRAGVEGLRRPG
jgi:hypothetical protein